MGSISKERPTPRVRVDADLAEKLGWMDKKVSIRAMIRRGTQQVTTWFYSGQILPPQPYEQQPNRLRIPRGGFFLFVFFVA